MKNLFFAFASLMFLGVCVCMLSAQDKQDDVVRIDTSLVNIPVIVSDRENRYIPGLTANDFKAFQDDVEQKIEIFDNEEAPMTIVLALDTSLSTAGVLDKIKKAAKEFIRVLGPDDRAMVVSFDNDVEFLSDLTSDKKVLEKSVKAAKIGDGLGTVIYDGLHAIITRKLKPIKGRKAIILLTDGKDHGSYLSKRELLDELAESDTVIYPVFYETKDMPLRRGGRQMPFPFPDRGGMGRPGGGMGRGGGMERPRGGMGRPGGGGGRGGGYPGGGFPGGRNRPNVEQENKEAADFLQETADATSGRFFKEKIADLPGVFQQIADEMKRQYLIGFYPPEGSPEGALHKIKVQVSRPNTVVRCKTTYRSASR